MRVLSLAALALLWFGCGGHDISQDPLLDASGVTIDAAPRIDGSPGQIDAAPGTPDAAPGTPDAAVNRAQMFCDRYDTLCGYDPANTDRYDDESACLTAFAGFDAAQRICVEGELDDLEVDGMLQHCRIATGVGRCG